MKNKTTKNGQGLKVTYVSPSILIPYVNNARTHSEQQIKQVAASIKEFGFTNPVLIDETNSIIAGHGRVMAATLIGLDEVPTITLTGLSGAQRKAYVLADNKLALNADWDIEMLMLEIDTLTAEDFDVSLIGFSDEEINTMRSDVTNEGLTDEDAVPEAPEIPKTVIGDVYKLGNHRLMCGDSTSIDAVETLIDNKKINMVFTDPPYGVSFNGRSGNFDVIKNDDLRGDDFIAFIDGFVSVLQIVNPSVYYVWCNWSFYGLLQDKLDYKACIVWAKNVFGLGQGYRHQHEFCLFNGKVDDVIKNESDLWEIKKDTKYVHPTQKPVALCIRAFGNHIKLTNVLDLFGGSGSTLIGAEQTGRNCYMMELDPKYCDVIVQRWEEFTGNKAELINGE
tara:strand:+ start:68 stop:1246 length:1179 start_codon:yes stop_codon:yes gene_type:complete